MTCHSGGTLDVFIEPVLPKPHVLILGRSPVARTLATLAKTIGYVVSVAAPGADREAFPGADSVQQALDLGQFRITPQTFIVVSTQGESDEEALEAAINAGSGYIAFVASKTKATKTLDDLKDRGLPADKVAKVRAPAGLDIHASSPEEIAVSILAEIIQLQKMTGFRGWPTAGLPTLAKAAKDPICGMTVDTISTKYMSEHAGVRYYFCCAGCKHTFDKDPQKYALPPTQSIGVG
jgi:xanthine dehydrogenase accessory factor